jgi:fatty acid desaturase
LASPIAPPLQLPREGLYDPERERDYADLKRRIVDAGLLRKQLGYYLMNTAIRLSLLAVSIAVLLLFDAFWVQALNAVFMAFAFTQIGYLGHDAGHRQVFEGAKKNDYFGLAINTVLGLSRSWWVDTHNQHHVSPNDLERDPHTALPIFAFSDEQARGKTGKLRSIVGYQAFYFFPVLLLEGIGVRAASIQYLLADRTARRWIELTAMALHFTVYLALVFYALQPIHALLFIVIHQSMFGLYMGSVFAPNHKGMPTIDAASELDFLRKQVLTSRDVKGHAVTDFVYGGLNYQIEHHLFPSMPRNKLGEAQVIVRQFCIERNIPYKESGAIESHREILSFLHEVSAPLRDRQTA